MFYFFKLYFIQHSSKLIRVLKTWSTSLFRFFCEICGAGLKRKDHLTRHKQSHNPERPFVCTVCLKAFKRKEQLTLHFVIHSGEKRHVCPECGKGFYRKDHLRKHARFEFNILSWHPSYISLWIQWNVFFSRMISILHTCDLNLFY